MEMDNYPIDLPAGFRFHPTDEELITHYLSEKVVDAGFSAAAVGEVDMNKVEPWDLPWRAKLGEKEWYFFCLRDKKYPTGARTNRATAAGYWKATGKDKEIRRGKALVGMKKTLVFYRGRAPRGEKTNWVCHEYRLEGKLCLRNLPRDWVLSRVFQKTSGGKKVHISGLVETKPEMGSGHVHCFSNAAKTQEDFINADAFAAAPAFPWVQFPAVRAGNGFQFPGYGPSVDSGFGKGREMVSVSQETGMSTENSSVVSNIEMGKNGVEEQLDLGCIWNY